jgi:hydroxymethylpyrimidine/phosphomethylpyrimidine kinase
VTGRVLCIGGSDSGCGAGIQADVKTVMALGGYATTAVTMLTAQNTLAVSNIHHIPLAFLREQIEMVLSDIGADAVKTGVLVDEATISLVAEILGPTGLPIVIDPVIVASTGAKLITPGAMTMLIRVLLPIAALLTPNVPEAEVLTGIPIQDVAAMQRAADVLLTLGVPAVLLKGGHMRGETVTDLLATPDGVTVFEHPRLESRHTHGTGCTLASAIATGLAQGLSLNESVERARRYVHAAIAAAPGLGAGSGPMNHGVRI